MPKFSFRLDTVLKLRKEQKKQVEMELAGVQMEKIKSQQTLQNTINNKSSLWYSINSVRKRQVFDFQTDYYHIDALDKNIENNLKKLERITKVENNVINEIIRLNKAQKTIEKLRERREEEFDKENDRKEKNYLDDISQKLKHQL